MMKRKNPTITAVSSLFLGPVGYLYLGINYFVAGISIAIIITLVLSLIRMPYPPFFNLLQLFVWAYYGYKIAEIRNAAIEEGLSDNDEKEFKSMSFSFFIMLTVMQTVVQLYAVVLVLFLTYLAFAQHKYFTAILILIFGVSLAKWILGFIFGLISVGIMKIFKIDKKYL